MSPSFVRSFGYVGLTPGAGFFTLGLGRMVGVETFTRAKVLAVLASFVGLLLVTHSDSMISTASTIISGQSITEDDAPDRRPKNALVGDALALLSAVCYAVYVILLKVKIEDEERVDMQLFFGYVLRLFQLRGSVDRPL